MGWGLGFGVWGVGPKGYQDNAAVDELGLSNPKP
jgi:hypothetical protein